MKLPRHFRMSRRDLLARGAFVVCAASLPSIRLRAQTVGPVMATLSSYMAAAKDRVLPAEVVEKAKHHIVDTFAAMLSGSELPAGRAALTLARSQAGRPVSTVVGSGVATKEQVQFMMTRLLRLKAVPSPSDAADGVAAAMTYLMTARVAKIAAVHAPTAASPFSPKPPATSTGGRR